MQTEKIHSEGGGRNEAHGFPREGAEEYSDGARPTASCCILGIYSQLVELIIFELFQFSYIYVKGTLCGLSVLRDCSQSQREGG